MRHKVADVHGPVHYIDFGGSGAPLLMVHGLAGNALNWMAKIKSRSPPKRGRAQMEAR